MMHQDELRGLCRGIRAGRVTVDHGVIDRIRSEVDDYRKHLSEPRPQKPPEELAERLPLIGWLIYEASWSLVQKVEAAFTTFEPGLRREHLDRVAMIERIAAAARRIPWPEYAPRALGAIRAQALAESKRDTEASYDAAWTLHREARTKHAEFMQYHRDLDLRAREVIGLQETFLQLALAETGTACRTAEQVISRWSERQPSIVEEESAEQENDRWTQRLYRQVTEGVAVGETALQVAAMIDEGIGLIPAGGVDEHRLAMVTAFQNPGIMTARAALIAYAFTPEVERLGRIPGEGGTWDEVRTALLDRFRAGYRAIERPVEGLDGRPASMNRDHQRALVQLRLNLAVLVPGIELPSQLDFAPCLGRPVLDDDAVEELSAWLADGRGGGNVIAAATMPSFIRSVVACRALVGVRSGYHEWRERWYVLGRYADEDGRRERVLAALAATRP